MFGPERALLVSTRRSVTSGGESELRAYIDQEGLDLVRIEDRAPSAHPAHAPEEGDHDGRTAARTPSRLSTLLRAARRPPSQDPGTLEATAARVPAPEG